MDEHEHLAPSVQTPLQLMHGLRHESSDADEQLELHDVPESTQTSLTRQYLQSDRPVHATMSNVLHLPCDAHDVTKSPVHENTLSIQPPREGQYLQPRSPRHASHVW